MKTHKHHQPGEEKNTNKKKTSEKQSKEEENKVKENEGGGREGAIYWWDKVRGQRRTWVMEAGVRISHTLWQPCNSIIFCLICNIFQNLIVIYNQSPQHHNYKDKRIWMCLSSYLYVHMSIFLYIHINTFIYI